MSHSRSVEWEQVLLDFLGKVEYVNSKIKINHWNLIGPMVGQKVHIKLEKLVLQVLSQLGSKRRQALKVTLGTLITIFGLWGINR